MTDTTDKLDGMVDDDLIERVSETVGYHPGAWDMVDPIELMRAALHAIGIEALVRDAERWRKHEGSFAVLQAMLDVASPLVLNRLKAADAAMEASSGR